MAHVKAPLIGDHVYGRHRGIKCYGEGADFIAATSLARSFPRQALHARSLGFTHPVTGRDVLFEADPPTDMQALIKALEAMPKG